MFQINLKKLRERNRWSQVELAKRLGVSQSTVGMWEAGRNKPTYATLLRIAREFDVSVDRLTGGADESAGFSALVPVEDTLASEAAPYHTASPSSGSLQRITMPDNSMAHEILAGDQLIVRPVPVIEQGNLIVFMMKNVLFVRKAFLMQGNIIAQACDATVPPVCFPEKDNTKNGIVVLGIVSELHRKFL